MSSAVARGLIEPEVVFGLRETPKLGDQIKAVNPRAHVSYFGL